MVIILAGTEERFEETSVSCKPRPPNARIWQGGVTLATVPSFFQITRFNRTIQHPQQRPAALLYEIVIKRTPMHIRGKYNIMFKGDARKSYVQSEEIDEYPDFLHRRKHIDRNEIHHDAKYLIFSLYLHKE